MRNRNENGEKTMRMNKVTDFRTSVQAVSDALISWNLDEVLKIRHQVFFSRSNVKMTEIEKDTLRKLIDAVCEVLD